jgi:hypothetical protein
MQATVERFPRIAARTIGPARLGVFGLELRLAPESDQVDLTFPILREDRDVIIALGESEEDGRWLHEDPVWRRVLGFCRRWADAGTLLGEHVELLWLELDVKGEAGEGGLPAPGVFVRFGPETTAHVSLETWRRILSEVLTSLTGHHPLAVLTTRFERCVCSLPANTFVQYIGLMLSRVGDTVRFVFSGFDEDDLPSFLETIGWPGEPAELRRHLEATTTAGRERLHRGASAAQVDIGPSGVLPSIGLEYVLDRSRQAEEGIQERAFLEHLAALGLTSEDKLQALLALPGRRIEPWNGLCLVGHSRLVHHVKLVLDPSGPKQAKAYYGRALVIQPLENAGSPRQAQTDA